MKPPVLEEAIEWGRSFLSGFDFDDPGMEARAILGGLLNRSDSYLLLYRKEKVPENVFKNFEDLIRRRATKEPVAYLLGVKNFRGSDFSVDPRVLIPRPETEFLVEKAMDALTFQNKNEIKILDIGTGSGCIACSVAQSIPSAKITAVDMSEGALFVARSNAKRLNVEGKIDFVQSDLYSGLSSNFRGYFDMILSNPPYVSSSQLTTLDPDLHFEPSLALNGGEDGLNVIRPLVQNAGAFLTQQGRLLIEIGFDQGERVHDLFLASGFTNVRVLKDDAGHTRLVYGER